MIWILSFAYGKNQVVAFLLDLDFSIDWSKQVSLPRFFCFFTNIQNNSFHLACRRTKDPIPLLTRAGKQGMILPTKSIGK